MLSFVFGGPMAEHWTDNLIKCLLELLRWHETRPAPLGAAAATMKIESINLLRSF